MKPASIFLPAARLYAFGLWLALASSMACAAELFSAGDLFGDSKARTAIIELRQHVEGIRLSVETMNQRVETLRQAVESQQQRMGAVYQAIEALRIRAESDRADFKQGSGRATDEVTKLREDLREDVTIVKGGILGLKNQIEELRSEAARMRGANEQLKRELSDGQIRQKDMAEGQNRQKDIAQQDLDKRFLAATQRLEQRLLEATKTQDEKFEKSQSTLKGLDDRLLAVTKGQEEKFEKLNSTVKGLDDRLLALPKGPDDTLRTTIQGLDAKVQGLDARLSATSQGMEERFRTVEPIKVTLDGREFMAEPAEKRDFEAALALFRKAEFTGANTAFFDFLSRYSRSGYAPSARFWLGNAQYAMRDYAGARANFQTLIASYPDHQRTPEALLLVANCQVELKDVRGARKTLQDLIRDYPKSEAASAARERLALLK
jgi:tol-pal system protein YbgF